MLLLEGLTWFVLIASADNGGSLSEPDASCNGIKTSQIAHLVHELPGRWPPSLAVETIKQT
jgi:hypothetical protein